MSLKCGQRLRRRGIVKEMPKVVNWVYKLQKPELGATQEVATAGRNTTATYEHNYLHSEKSIFIHSILFINFENIYVSKVYFNHQSKCLVNYFKIYLTNKINVFGWYTFKNT